MPSTRSSKIFTLLFCIASTAIPGLVNAQSDKLVSLQQWIEDSFPTVEHIGSAEFLETTDQVDDVVVFDVREPDEYDVSHLDGAIQVDPEISTDDFMQLFGTSLKDKKVVFYCSVGRRSSLLADKVTDALVDNGSTDIYNLKHGIFGWHDENKPLVSAGQSTDYVHPFSWRWKKYLQRKDMARYEPE